jgi:hypothetical protein
VGKESSGGKKRFMRERGYDTMIPDGAHLREKGGFAAPDEMYVMLLF